MANLTLDAVRKRYPGGIEAVRGVSLEVPDGAFCVLVGPSGCGKSTLLRMIAGLETVSEGSVLIGGRRVNQVEPASRDIAMVFQSYALYPHMSVYDNMAYGLRNRGVAKDEIDRSVRQAAGRLGLAAMLDRRPRALSGGQRQRVAMGRAIVRRPQVFLFDEPLSNLDATLRVQMRVEIKRLQRELGTTAVYVTHDQVEAMTLADVLVVMNEGAVEQAGSASALYRHPQTRFVATFLGSPPMNLLAGRAEAGGLVVGETRIAATTGTLAPGAPVQVGLRPEALRLAEPGPGRLPFRFDFAEELGATRLFYGTSEGQAVIVQQAVEGPSPGELGPGESVPGEAGAGGLAPGATGALAFEPANLHLFDPETGRRAGG